MARIIDDPTREQMQDTLRLADAARDYEFDREEAMYWFAADYHGGQSSNLYAALSASPYRPSPLHRGVTGASARWFYEALEAAYVTE